VPKTFTFVAVKSPSISTSKFARASSKITLPFPSALNSRSLFDSVVCITLFKICMLENIGFPLVTKF